MSSALVMGQPNVGKTSFTLNFADYLGVRRLKLTIRQPEGFSSTCSYFIHEAREKLISSKPNETLNLQSITLSLPMGKGRKAFQLLDSCGLSEGIHPEAEMRKAMSQTIRFINQCELIFHLMDVSRINGKGTMDHQINSYASLRPVYCLLVNKMDLPEGEKNYPLLKERYSHHPIIPISATKKEGFKEVKIFLMKNL